MKTELFRKGINVILNLLSFGLLCLVRRVVKNRKLRADLTKRLDKNKDGVINSDDVIETIFSKEE